MINYASDMPETVVNGEYSCFVKPVSDEDHKILREDYKNAKFEYLLETKQSAKIEVGGVFQVKKCPVFIKNSMISLFFTQTLNERL